ncbi:MAG: hypothetical protein IPN76_17090 [Saprospiraceae bacterium]|nr:hypothetical protein [Saprospiraceae bacterium]
MENTSDLKVAITSRAAIDSLSNSKEEFSTLISMMDKEIGDNSQQVRISNDASNTDQIGRINKLKIHRKMLQDMLAKMELMQEENWETLRPEAKETYEAATATML